MNTPNGSKVAGPGWRRMANRAYYTRHPEPEWWDSSGDVLDLMPAQQRMAMAIHEAGHAVLYLGFGVPLRSMELLAGLAERDESGFRPTARVTLDAFSLPVVDYWAACAAGERAMDRWLREQELWTPRRAWAAEVGAATDRAEVEESARELMGETVTYGLTDHITDYAVMQAHADAALAVAWPEVLRLADALAARGFLTGDDAKEVTGIGWTGAGVAA